jgi:predicted RNase H-like HicB family nuclease
MKFTVVLVKTEEGFSISAPTLPGCYSQGATKAEALENIQDAIQGYIEVTREMNVPLAQITIHEVEVDV